MAEGNSGGWWAGEPVVCILLTTFDNSREAPFSLERDFRYILEGGKIMAYAVENRKDIYRWATLH